jgi:hypothetical protein
MKLHEIPPALLCFARSKREWVHSALAFYLSDGRTELCYSSWSWNLSSLALATCGIYTAQC